MGRLKRIYKGLRSTWQPPPPIITDNPLDPPWSHTGRKHKIGMYEFHLEDLDGIICTALPGSFPFISSRGNNYIFIMYDFDYNSILSEPIKSRKPITSSKASPHATNESRLQEAPPSFYALIIRFPMWRHSFEKLQMPACQHVQPPSQSYLEGNPYIQSSLHLNPEWMWCPLPTPSMVPPNPADLTNT